MLLLADGQVTPVADLVDALWDGEPPASARHQVHKTVAALRLGLGDVIKTDGPGYRIDLDNAEVDVRAFRSSAATGTISGLVAALALWRGPALAGMVCRAVRGRADTLDEERLAVTEALIDLRLNAGRASSVAAELPALVAANPLRERLRAQLIVALYQSGRQAEAHAAYAEARALLADELGVDPGPELLRLHGQMLRGDPALDRPVPRTPDTLPYNLPDFVGRESELERLACRTLATPIAVIDGMAGVGKTALAVHAAHALWDSYPDGQLFCDLHGHTSGARPVEPEAALATLLVMLGVHIDSMPEGLDQRAARWRAELAGKRILLVLDNAASAAQVRPLLPGGSRCLTMVTSRQRLGTLDGAVAISLEVLPEAAALALFGAVAGTTRIAAERAASGRVVSLCGHLPLAIRIAGARLAHRRMWTVETLATRLQLENDRLDVLALEDRGVSSAFALSYAQLTSQQQRMFRLLGLHAGRDFDAYSAAALAGAGRRCAEDLLDGLVDAHLLRHSAPGRYGFHDLLRDYARRLADAEDGEPSRRLHDYYLAVATSATDLISPEARRFEPDIERVPCDRPTFDDVDDALSWLAVEQPTLLSAVESGDGWQLACVLRAFFEHRGHFADWRATHEWALGRTSADPRATALLRFNLGALAMWIGRYEEGLVHFREALAHVESDPELAATALTNMGMLTHLLDRDDEAAGYLRRALAIDHHNIRTKALGWNNLGLTEGRSGRSRLALGHHQKALRLARQIGSPTAERGILLGLGETLLRLGMPASEPFRCAAAMARAGRFRMQEALALDGLAHATGDSSYWVEAMTIFTELGVRHAGLVRRHLDRPHEINCDLCRPRPQLAAARATTARSAVRTGG